jgi:hypothetical protein
VLKVYSLVQVLLYDLLINLQLEVSSPTIGEACSADLSAVNRQRCRHDIRGRHVRSLLVNVEQGKCA